MGKKGQITIFVILGILILAIAIIAVYITQKSKEAKLQEGLTETSRLPIEMQEEKTSIEECMSEVLQEAAIKLGINGGYINDKPEKTINYLGFDVAYVEAISKEKIESELGDYIKSEFGRCKDNAKVNDATVTLDLDKITAEAEMPVTLTSGETSAKISHFSTESGIKLGTMINIAENIQKDKDCVSCLMEETLQNNMKATINILEDTRIYTIEDKNYAIEFAVD